MGLRKNWVTDLTERGSDLIKNSNNDNGSQSSNSTYWNIICKFKIGRNEQRQRRTLAELCTLNCLKNRFRDLDKIFQALLKYCWYEMCPIH